MDGSGHGLILAIVFNSAIKVAQVSIQQKSSFCGQKNEEIPLGCINCIEAHLFRVNIKWLPLARVAKTALPLQELQIVSLEKLT